jgi:hypothetical protein
MDSVIIDSASMPTPTHPHVRRQTLRLDTSPVVDRYLLLHLWLGLGNHVAVLAGGV